VWRILKAMRWSLQRPARKAVERNEAAIARWVAEELIATAQVGSIRVRRDPDLLRSFLAGTGLSYESPTTARICKRRWPAGYLPCKRIFVPRFPKVLEHMMGTTQRAVLTRHPRPTSRHVRQMCARANGVTPFALVSALSV
jgi:hypothetical protein